MSEPPPVYDINTKPPDGLAHGPNAETCITFHGDTRSECNIWTNDRTVVTMMRRAGFEPDEETEHGVQYIGIPTKRVFRPTKARKPLSEKRRTEIVQQLAKG